MTHRSERALEVDPVSVSASTKRTFIENLITKLEPGEVTIPAAANPPLRRPIAMTPGVAPPGERQRSSIVRSPSTRQGAADGLPPPAGFGHEREDRGAVSYRSLTILKLRRT